MYLTQKDGSRGVKIASKTNGFPLLSLVERGGSRIQFGMYDENPGSFPGILLDNPKSSITVAAAPKGESFWIMESGESTLSAIVEGKNSSLTAGSKNAKASVGVHEQRAGVVLQDAQGSRTLSTGGGG